jgi:AraC-like DNA-binding protein
MPRPSTTVRSRNSLAPGIAALAQREGCSTTRYPGVVVWRMTVAQPPTPTLYAASLILVGSGAKQATLGDQSFVYNADHLLVVTSPLPMLCRTIASVDEPVLTVVVEIELALLRELLFELNLPAAPQLDAPARTVFRAGLSRELEDAGSRLLAHLTEEQRTRALVRHTIREMLFLVLETPYGNSLRAITEGAPSQFAHVLRHVNANFAERMTIAELADMARTSVPTFHQRFKAMTGTSPLQYIKTLRLTRARQMLGAGGMVKTVAQAVGYESESQFSREYRRLFGAPPSTSSHMSPRERS